MSAAVQASASQKHLSDATVTVVKLGGSIVRSGSLPGWLDAIAHVHPPVVVVPGGGALADEVRQCQRQLGFGDAIAHRMALLAMDQLAWAIAGLRPGFEVGTTLQDLRAIHRRERVAVWAPSAFLAGRADVEATWRLTSDSLALWLAGKLGAQACCVVKSAPIAHGALSADVLCREGIVDEAFPSMLAETRIACSVFGPGDEKGLSAFLAREAAAPNPVTG
ncbi:MAG: hypothetical protein QNJ62_13085 [Methyloceanibacter sp.]|nr:hypothetical protein [Methyloceanibacter sp.]